MKFLFDENISYRIVKKIKELATDSLHVSSTELTKPSIDTEIWEYARRNDFLLVTFDEDFEDLANLHGFPPKVVLLRTGNSSTQFVADILLKKLTEIKEFYKSDVYGLLEIF